MAQVRVSALAGISRFGYAVAGWSDNAQAASELGRRYGYRLEPAEIELNRRYDRAWGTVKVDGRTILEAGLFDPEPVSPADANHQGHLNLAVAGGDLVLVQTGPQLRFHRCDRGRPDVRVFASETIGCDAPYWEVSAFTGSCDFLFSPPMVACAPHVPAIDGQLLVTGGMQALS
jgi:hypothetical protein